MALISTANNCSMQCSEVIRKVYTPPLAMQQHFQSENGFFLPVINIIFDYPCALSDPANELHNAGEGETEIK